MRPYGQTIIASRPLDRARVQPLASRRRAEREAMNEGLRKLRIVHERLVESMRAPITKLTEDFKRITAQAQALGLIVVGDEQHPHYEKPRITDLPRGGVWEAPLYIRLLARGISPRSPLRPDVQAALDQVQSRVLAELGPGPGRDHG